MQIISIYLKTKFIYIYLTFFYLPDCTPTLHLQSSQRVFQRNLIHTNILSKAYQSYHCLLHVPRFIFCYPITSIIYLFIYLFIYYLFFNSFFHLFLSSKYKQKHELAYLPLSEILFHSLRAAPLWQMIPEFGTGLKRIKILRSSTRTQKLAIFTDFGVFSFF